jgi:hypothetical protein
MSAPKVKKPRQRKDPVLSIVEAAEAALVTAGVPGVVEPKEKKTRAKKAAKPVQVVAVVTSDGIDGNFMPEPRRPLIVHFPFNSTEVSFNDNFQYDPNPPPQVQPYDGDQMYFQVNSEKCSDENQIGVELDGWKMSLEEQKKGAEVGQGLGPVAIETGLVKMDAKEKEKEKEAYIEKVEKKQLLTCYAVATGETFVPPATTEVQCFWCTHAFEGSPYFLPVKEENKTFHVYGNYCSPQCALGYLLYEHLDSHVRWERMSLLHRMYKSSGRLYPAPPRESLKSYGGIYTIEEFRKIIADNRVRVDVQIPPMVSILGTLDTKPIDFYDSSLQNTFTQGFSMDRFKAWSEQGGALRLKRSKPLKDVGSTLDACIQISVKRG